jgi:DNA polymerase
MTRSPDIALAARQVLLTDLLCGVDFVPAARPGSEVSSAEPEETLQVRRPDVARDTVEFADSEVEIKPAAVQAAVERSPTRDSIIKRQSDPAVLRQKQAKLDSLREKHDKQCLHCTTAGGHTRLVFGEGNPDADLMFIGEAPGAEEDKTGRPFVGRAGQKLDEIIRAMGFQREEVYIANVLKARPPENRTPTPLEAQRCSPWLAGQVRIIQPRVIVGLGKPACQFLLGRPVSITRERGQWQEYVSGLDAAEAELLGQDTSGSSGDSQAVRVPVMPTFHPAYILRNYTMEVRQAVWDDMQAVMRFLGSSR